MLRLMVFVSSVSTKPAIHARNGPRLATRSARSALPSSLCERQRLARAMGQHNPWSGDNSAPARLARGPIHTIQNRDQATSARYTSRVVSFSAMVLGAEQGD